MRYIIRIQQLNNTMLTIDCAENETILSAMVRQKIQYRSDCGGRGTCGKCKIQVIIGRLDSTIQDRKIFTEEELQGGYRLSCKAFPCEDLTIKLLSRDEVGMEVVTENRINLSDHKANIEGKTDNYVIGIDLGTTTLAVSLVNIASKDIIRTYSTINPQKAYGADVISRMKVSIEGKGDQLRYSVQKCLIEAILSVLRESGIEISNIEKIAIAGNTTMGHLLMGYSCETLGVFPFTPVNIDTIEVDFQDIFSVELFKNNSLLEDSNIKNADLYQLQKVPVVILPGISTFVGGDIVAGLSVCGFDAAKKPCLLIDLGTNGEMALGNKEHILVTSTAAGPAFEGGNISCGVGSIPGAISHIIINGEEIIYETIGNKPPVGICGTGVVELVSELFKANLIDETGLLVDEYFHKGFPITEMHNIVFTQKDIREFQLAKAAVRAGIEVLIKSYGITLQQIDKVYLAGGFGYKIDVEKAIHIGLIPEELRGKILVIGNSSLAGAMGYLTEQNSKEKVERIISISKEIHLSNDDDFYDLYLKHMSFEKSDWFFE
ncbi:MAG: ASKHA domain-containing protein [Mobilitalea sp.]